MNGSSVLPSNNHKSLEFNFPSYLIWKKATFALTLLVLASSERKLCFDNFKGFLKIPALLSNICGRFHQHFCQAFSREQDEKHFWRMVFSKWQIDLANFTIHFGQISSSKNVGEIEWRIFCRTMLAHKGW